jgi:putative DNA primase/helicase
MVDYLQRVAGYAATGHSREQKLLFFHGSGGNGKGAFLRTISKALGTYALAANLDFAQAARYHGHPTDISQLRDRRLVLLAELGQGDQIDEARIKALTGGDVLSGLGIGQDFESFEPTQTYILATNHLPAVRSQDDGTWRRFVVIRWEARLVENPSAADLAAGAIPLDKSFEDGLASGITASRAGVRRAPTIHLADRAPG